MTTTSRPIAFFDMKAQQALIRAEIDAGIARILDHGRFIQGPEVDALEAPLAAFAGAKHAVGVSSGTDALQIAMMAEGIGPGDAVFLPAFTYTATAEVPLVLGATPIFVDVDDAHLQPRPGRSGAPAGAGGEAGPAAAARGDGRRSLRPAGGLAGDRGALRQARHVRAGRRGAGLRRRARTAAGSAPTPMPRRCSFYPTKTLGCYGDGGAILTDDADRAELYRSLRTHGEGKTRYEVLRTGMNGRLDSIQAAILLAKLPLLEGELVARARAAAWYEAALAGRVRDPAGRARRRERLGHLHHAAAGCRGPRPGAGVDAGGRRAERHLLPEAAAPAAGLCRGACRRDRRRRAAAAGQRGPLRPGACRCRCTPT